MNDIISNSLPPPCKFDYSMFSRKAVNKALTQQHIIDNATGTNYTGRKTILVKGGLFMKKWNIITKIAGSVSIIVIIFALLHLFLAPLLTFLAPGAGLMATFVLMAFSDKSGLDFILLLGFAVFLVVIGIITPFSFFKKMKTGAVIATVVYFLLSFAFGYLMVSHLFNGDFSTAMSVFGLTLIYIIISITYLLGTIGIFKLTKSQREID